MPSLIQMLKENPERPIAIEDDIKIQGLKNPLYLIIVGLSTLKLLEVIKKLKKEVAFVVIIEPDIGIFHQTLKREWMGWIVNDPRIDLIVGIRPEELTIHLTKLFATMDKKHGARASKCATPEIIADPFAYPGNHPLISQVQQVVNESVKQVFLSMGCAADSFTRWEQVIRNEKNLQKSFRIKPLFEKFSDVPIVVLGAGPSLKDFIDAYHKYDLKDRCLIIACDASLRKLLDHQIRPHLVTRCERKLTTIFRGIERSDTQGIYYAAYPWCPPEYFDLFESSFMLFRDNGVCKWTGYDPGSVNGGVSSANAALELAFLFSAKTIILSGIDLCFLDEKSHIEGTEVEFDVEKSRPKWKEIASNEEGKTVTSIPVWMRCLNEYQGSIYKHYSKRQDFKVYNTSLRGAKIQGTELISFASLQELTFKETFDLGKKIKDLLDLHNSNYETSYLQKKKDTISFLKKVSNEFQKAFSNASDTLNTAFHEEQKIMEQLKVISDPAKYFSTKNQMLKELTKIYSEPCRLIDQFRQAFYVKELFSNVVMDICQLDLFQSENKAYSLANVIDVDHERLKHYADIHLRLFKIFEYYTHCLIDLLENGYQEKERKLPDVYDLIEEAG